MHELGKIMIVIGVVLVIIGALWMLFGRLPGDFVFRKGKATIYFPIMTCIIISIVLSLIFYLLNRFR
ncbi:DUF2905 domain-containing protein [Camelliibacillus cellulosilyticus]|uniref:DUF2905 domain-containing protein n=1 Tax=Camelliibacillus cellulosilyticus TaxID=2174486 RepID=A0ABV9GJA3_9BACL